MPRGAYAWKKAPLSNSGTGKYKWAVPVEFLCHIGVVPGWRERAVNCRVR